MIAVDSNFLVYAHRRDSPFFTRAFQVLAELAEGSAPWAVPWPCIRIYKPPTPLAAAIRQVDFWRESPSIRMIGELDDHWTELGNLLRAGKIQGGAVHDARIAAICIEHGVKELWTIDRDFSRFPGIHTVNPLSG